MFLVVFLNIVSHSSSCGSYFFSPTVFEYFSLLSDETDVKVWYFKFWETEKNITGNGCLKWPNNFKFWRFEAEIETFEKLNSFWKNRPSFEKVGMISIRIDPNKTLCADRANSINVTAFVCRQMSFVPSTTGQTCGSHFPSVPLWKLKI